MIHEINPHTLPLGDLAPVTADPSALARRVMVETQLLPNEITHSGLLNAMKVVARETFVPDHLRAAAYAEKDLILGDTPDKAALMTAPVTFAKMIQAAAPKDTESVLDIGCAYGYSIAILARLCHRVIGIDADRDRVSTAQENLHKLGIDNAAVCCNPLDAGDPDGALYDVIVIEVMVDLVSEAVLAQLKQNGRLVVLLTDGAVARAWLYRKVGSGVSRHFLFDCDPVYLPQSDRKPVFRF